MKIIAIDTPTVTAWRQGQPDAQGHTPERMTASTGSGTPCRHCLAQVPEWLPYLVLAHRPFGGLNPYTECGPIFVCADDCDRGGPGIPATMLAAPGYIVRGYRPMSGSCTAPAVSSRRMAFPTAAPSCWRGPRSLLSTSDRPATIASFSASNVRP